MSLFQHLQRAEDELDDFEDIGLSIFLIALFVLSFAIFPFVEMGELSGRLVSLGYTVLFLAGSLIGDVGRGWRRTMILLAVTGAVLSWLPAAAEPGGWRELNLVLSIIFNLMICVALLRQVFRPGVVNGHRFRGAMAVYVLIGFLFALIFLLLEDLAPGSFAGIASDTGDRQVHDLVYFSYVTLTTVGYGEITPISDAARSLAVVEALIGQIFLAILIGRLVTLSGQNDQQA